MPATMKGAISFGLLHVPIPLHTVTQDNDISFHQLCREDGSRVRYKKACAGCGKEVSGDSIVKGFEIEPRRYATLTDEDFEKATAEKSGYLIHKTNSWKASVSNKLVLFICHRKKELDAEQQRKGYQLMAEDYHCSADNKAVDI